MKRFSLFLILTIGLTGIPQSIQAQEGWVRIYGGADEDWGQCVRQTSDGGYIVTGGTRSFGVGESDLWVLKTDSTSDTLWTRTYGGWENDYGVCTQETSDGNYVVLGMTKSSGSGGSDIWLLKVGSTGNKIWERTYGGGLDDLGYWVEVTSDGGYIIVGETHSYGENGDLWLIKVDASGNTSWSQTYGGDSLDWGEYVIETSDGSFVITGGTRSFGVVQTELWLFKVDAVGSILWERLYGWRSWEWGKCVKETPDGGYIVAGPRDQATAGIYDVWLLRTDSSGDTLWTRNYGGNKWDWVSSIDQTSDGGYIFTGETQSAENNSYDLWLYKVDAQGDSVWAYTYGGDDWEWGSSVQETSDGGFIIAGSESFGSEESDLWLLKTNQLGNIGVEISPTRILKPQEGELIYSMEPSAMFTNFSQDYTFPAYYHCQITSLGTQDILYHDSTLNTFDPWTTNQIDFEVWTSPDISEFTATFYVTPAVEDSFLSRPMSVTFIWTATEEQMTDVPTIEMVRSVGQKVALRYANWPDGFAATIYDATGRKVDELYSIQQSGTITWGKERSPGVYFLQSGNSETKTLKVILIR